MSYLHNLDIQNLINSDYINSEIETIQMNQPQDYLG